MRLRTVSMELRFKELMILDHALNKYINRDGASESDVRSENDLLDRVNSKIKILRERKDNGEEKQSI